MAEAVRGFALSGLLSDRVACIELNTRKIRIAFHADPGLWLICFSELHDRSSVLADHKIVVIAAHKLQLPVIRPDVLPDCLRCGEIKRRPRNRSQFTGRNRLMVDDRCVIPAGKPQLRVLDGSARVTAQVEIGMVCHIAYGILIALRTILQTQRIVIGQGVSHGRGEIARIALLQIGIPDLKCDRILQAGNHLGPAPAEDVRTAVQIVFIVVHRKMVSLSVQGELCLADPVSAAADPGTEVSSVGKVLFRCVVAKNDILQGLVLVLQEDRDYRSAQIRQLNLHPVRVRDGIHRIVISERFFCYRHLFSPLDGKSPGPAAEPGRSTVVFMS